MRSVSVLAKSTVNHFREHAFDRGVPTLWPNASFIETVPAVSRWFLKEGLDGQPTLNKKYLSQQPDFDVPIEITSAGCTQSSEPDNLKTMQKSFERVEVPFSRFTEAIDDHPPSSGHSLYIAQCPLDSLPSGLQKDLPAPPFVFEAGRGDIYNSSIWLGRAPTFTPLHKDPNPNLFVQMAGRKVVRIYEPEVGRAIFQEAQRRMGAVSSASFRGEEMMHGQEREVLERMVWNDEEEQMSEYGHEADLEGGDGLFIPRGWWHSIKGVGEGINGSVNWWFR